MALKLYNETDIEAIADAIRGKNGSSDTYKVSEMADAIDDIPTGGGQVVEPDPLDVDIIDYDGTLLYTYTAQDFLALTELPANPSHNGLVAQGWNWSLADAKSYVAKYGALVIGQNYITNDGKTRLYVKAQGTEDQARRTATLRFGQTASNGVRVDWGDGSTPETFSGTGLANYTHQYTSNGRLVITLEVLSGTLSLEGAWNQNVFGDFNAHYSPISLLKVEIGEDCIVDANAFTYCPVLSSISIPKTLSKLGTSSTFSGTRLRAIVFPEGLLITGSKGTFDNISWIKAFSFPKNFNSASNGYLTLAQTEKLMLPNNWISYGTLDSWRALRVCILSETMTSIAQAFFNRCMNLTKLTIPASVTSIANAFQSCVGLRELHMKRETPPDLTAAIDSGVPSDMIIYVPYSSDHSILNAYKEATNWSTRASNIVEEPT